MVPPAVIPLVGSPIIRGPAAGKRPGVRPGKGPEKQTRLIPQNNSRRQAACSIFPARDRCLHCYPR